MESLAPTPPAQAIAVLPRSSILVAALSTVVEWYDFTLYLYMTTVLSRVFFGTGSTSLLITLAVFAVAYLMRPLGAMAFGHIGDRLGRRKVLLGSMAVMTAAMLATALLPTHDQIGSAAGALLLLLRCVMGFAVGGEYTGVTAYLVEGAPPHRRGLVASLASAASEIGALLAAGVAALTVTLVPGPTLDAWGWRIPFLFGTLLATTVLIARSTMRESPAFEQQPPPDTKGAGPLMTTLRTQRTALYRTFAISALGSVTYYVGISYVPTYLGAVSGFSESDALWLSTIAALVVIVVTPFAGALSDRRRPPSRTHALRCPGGDPAAYHVRPDDPGQLRRRTDRRGRPGLRGRRHQRGRGLRDRRTVPRRPAPQRPRARRHRSHRPLRRTHPVRLPGPGRLHRLGPDPRRPGRRHCPGRPARPAPPPGNRASRPCTPARPSRPGTRTPGPLSRLRALQQPHRRRPARRTLRPRHSPYPDLRHPGVPQHHLPRGPREVDRQPGPGRLQAFQGAARINDHLCEFCDSDQSAPVSAGRCSQKSSQNSCVLRDTSDTLITWT